jgi:molybdopterin-guanine dinucleotide biosynthesis protein A
MGRDKALLRLGGATLLERAVGLIRDAGGEPLIVAPDRPGYEAAGARRVDEAAGDAASSGPLAALRHGLRACGASTVVALACDLPLVPPALLRHLAATVSRYDAVVPRASGELQVLAAAYAARCLPALDRCLNEGRYSVHGFVSEVRVKFLDRQDLEPFGGEEIFLNVNEPSDLARAEVLLARRAG